MYFIFTVFFFFFCKQDPGKTLSEVPCENYFDFTSLGSWRSALQFWAFTKIPWELSFDESHASFGTKGKTKKVWEAADMSPPKLKTYLPIVFFNCHWPWYSSFIYNCNPSISQALQPWPEGHILEHRKYTLD